MSEFQALAVRGTSGPVVTLQAGVDFGGHYWTTTSRHAAKVAALRCNSSASVLSRKDASWRLRAGRAVVIDVSRAPEMRELPVYALAGSALALIAVRYPEQLLGYVADVASIPKAWRLHHRVLIAVRHEEELVWTDDGVVTHRTGRFRHDRKLVGSARPTTPRSTARRGPAGSLLDVNGNCWLGLDTHAGPIVLPGDWRARNSAVGVPATVLAAVNPRLPGRACVTIDDSDSPRPSGKSGILARGGASLARAGGVVASIVVEVDSTTTWNGFRAQSTAA